MQEETANVVVDERIGEIWKKTIETDLKLSSLTESVQTLLQSVKELATKIEEVKEMLSEFEIEEEEESSDDEAVKVEIVTTETPQEQAQVQAPKKGMMRRLIFG